MKWKFIVHRRLALLFFELITLGQPVKEVKNSLGLNIGLNYYRSIDGRVEESEEELKKIEKYFEEKLEEKGIEFFESIVKKWKMLGKKLIEIAEEISKKDYSDKTDKELIKELNRLKKGYYNLSSSLNLLLLMGNVFEKHIREFLKKKVSKEKAEEYFITLTTTERDTEGTLEMVSILKIAQKHLKGEKLKNAIEEHIKEFGWINARGFVGKEWSFEEVESRVKELEQSNCKKKLEEFEHKNENVKKESEIILKELKADKELRKIVALTKEMVALRTDRMDIFGKAGFLARPLFREIGKRADLKLNDVFYLLTKEIEGALLKKKNFKELIEERKKGFCFFNINNKIWTLSGKESEEFKEKNRQQIEESDELKGMIAYKGTAKGKAKIVLSKKDITKMEEGDILIASMTTPEYIHAMRKASAIVTDEGGITCHAAIVSRELGIPCVTGTKVATKTFKNGDLVEVDANNGVVRKIEKQTFKRVNWYHDVPNQRAPFYIFYIVFQCIDRHNQYYKRKVQDIFFSVKNTSSTRACYSEPDIREGAKSLLNLCLNDKNFLRKTEKLMIQRSKEVLNSARKFEGKNHRTLKQLTGLLKEIHDRYIKYFVIVMIPELSVEFVEKEFDKELTKVFKSRKSEYVNILSTPRESFLEKEKKELLAISKKKNFKKLLKEHVKKYFWIGNNYVDTKKLKEDYFLKRLKNLEIYEDNNLEKKRKLLNSLKGEKYRKLKTLANIIEFLTFTQDLRKRTIMKVSYYINEILKQIGKKKGYTFEEMLLLKQKEMYKLEKETISKKTLLKRRTKMLSYYHEGKIHIYEGEEANKMEKIIAPIEISDRDSFKGRSAYGGKVTGVVRVVKSLHELKRLKQGEILVTSNTTPDFVSYLHKAKAIITEKGGVTTHAAIISRELKIPCIVGIKHITMALKDGYYVEVDANKGVITKIKEEKVEWFATSSRGKPHAILFIDSAALGIRRDYAHKLFGVNYKINNYRQFNNQRAIGIEDYNNINRILEGMNKRNPLIFYKFGALMEKIAKQIIKFTDKYKHSNWKKLSNKQLSNLLEESCDLQARLWGGVIFYGYYFYFNDIFMERFIKELEKLKKSDEKLIEYITSPEEISMIGKEKTELLKLAKKHLQTKNKLNKELEEHWQKYRFLNRYYFWGEGYSVKDIKNRFKEIVKKEKEHIDEELEKMKPLKINLKDYNLNKYQQGIIKSARKVSLIMNLADESVNYHFHYMNELYREIARRFQISYEQLVSMRREEIKKSLADNRLAIPKKELTLRLKEHALLYGHNAPSVLTGKELEKYKKKEIKEEETDINEIKGTSVSKKKEKITGKVRIIMEIEDGRDFKEREIIVTPMTNPALVPIMEKAAAIVTDEGGLLSHAAIVSRELGTPCIVGTKNATRAFKNGDIVEVDADKGIVRKIT